ncbi:MAG: sulfatase-like hydrolase/transferase [Acidobacteriota bacterium]
MKISILSLRARAFYKFNALRPGATGGMLLTRVITGERGGIGMSNLRGIGRGAAGWVVLVVFSVGVLVASLLAKAGGSSNAIPSAFSRSPRNVIVICMDTVRFDSFSLPERSGNPDLFTPWIAQAIDYHNASSVSSWTIPSVATVLTGLYPQQHAAGSLAGVPANLSTTTPTVLSGEAVTFPDILRTRNFTTYAITASPFVSETTGLLKGIERSESVASTEVAPHAVKWLQDRASQSERWFLYLHFMDAHEDHIEGLPEVRLHAAELSPALRQATLRTAPRGICADPGNDECLRYQAYVNSLTRLRKNLGTVLNALARTGLQEDTLVVLFSDHGEEFREHRTQELALGGDMRGDTRGYYGEGHGQSMFRELLHVPVLVWYPGIAPRVSAAPISLVDLAPSILDWVKAPPLPTQAGRTLDARATRRSLPPHRMMFASGIAYGYPQQAVTWNEWKLIQVSCVGEQYLFNHRTDPEEQHPVHDVAVERSLARGLLRYDGLDSLRRNSASRFSEEQLSSLRSLGYLQGGPATARVSCPKPGSLAAAGSATEAKAD